MNVLSPGQPVPNSVAILQPYFLPHAPYFSLMKAVQTFVIFDDVQFTRRSWISRNRVRNNVGDIRWMSIPIASHPRETEIKDIKIAARDWGETAANRFPSVRNAIQSGEQWARLFDGECLDLTEVLVSSIECVRSELAIDTPMIRSSEIEYDRSGSGQDKIISICMGLGADVYINPPGGRALYSQARFAKSHLELRFQVPTAPQLSILEALFGGIGRPEQNSQS